MRYITTYWDIYIYLRKKQDENSMMSWSQEIYYYNYNCNNIHLLTKTSLNFHLFFMHTPTRVFHQRYI